MLIKEYLEKNLIKFPVNSHPEIIQLAKKVLEEFGEIKIITKKAKNLSAISVNAFEVQVLIPEETKFRLDKNIQKDAILSVLRWENMTTFAKHPSESLRTYCRLRPNRWCSVRFIPISDSKL